MKKIIIYTDGGSRGNPGKAAIGVIFCNEKGEVIKKFGEYLGDNLTNNEAEYQAVIFALKKFKSVFGKSIAKVSEVEVRSDSELLVNQMSGKYKIENENIQKFFIEIWNLMIDFQGVKFKAIPREKNKEADAMVNEALDGLGSSQKLF
ncbi:MAG: ribonuclease HI family protein [Candidatus Staskawiczbacteria bacterium]|nr:ribonuclease HI family protein [Candidatus Staskawiczbacteria bacterium]